MVIGFDGSRAFSKDRTGTENYSHQLLKALAKIDHVNSYVVYFYLQSNLQGDVLRGWPRNFQFRVINWPRFWTQGGLALQTFKDKLDVLFVPAHTLPIIRRPRLKTVMTIHDLGAEYLPKHHQLKQQLYLKYITKYQLESATKLIAVSNATKKDLVTKAGMNPGKISVVYEGYDNKLFKGDRLVNSLSWYDLEVGKYFLFVGTIQPRKNLERLIIAFSVILSEAKNISFGLRPQDDNLKLVIVGSKGWMSEGIYSLPKKLGIEDKVKFLGYVPDKDIPALYSGAIALTFPSLFEGFGLPILEAQACGCPVITSNISSMPEVGGKGAILVDPYSTEDITNAMIKVMDKRIREDLIKAGYENVKKFSWEKCARETLKVLTI